MAGSGVRLHSLLVGAAHHDVLERGTYVGPALSSHHLIEAELLDMDHLAAHREHRGIGPDQPRAEAAGVDHHLGLVRQPAERHPGDRAAGLDDLVGQPAQVDRHLDDRRPERLSRRRTAPASRAPGCGGDGSGPPRVGRPLRCSSVPSTIATPVSSSAASRSNSVNEVADHADTRS